MPAARTRLNPTPPKDEALESYFRALDRLPIMSADVEHERAVEIRELRTAYWQALFGYEPLAADVAKAARAHLGARAEKLPASDCGIDSLIDALVDADPACDAADQIMADLAALQGQPRAPNTFSVRTSARNTKRFRDYIRNAQRRRLALHNARRAFAAANLRLVITVARRYTRNGFIAFADLIQDGNVGLLTAVDRFDPRRGFRFSTYAAWWIRHAITRALSDRGRPVRLPVHVIELRSRLRKIAKAFEQKNRRSPTDAELADAAEVPVVKVERMGRVLLQQDIVPALADDEASGLDTLDRLPGDDDDPAALMDNSVQSTVLHRGLDDLRPMESAILRMRFGFDDDPPKTLREVGEVYSLSRERIRQVQNRALEKLRTTLEAEGFDASFVATAVSASA